MTKHDESQLPLSEGAVSLKNRLEETEETLRAIRQYMVDAFVITRESGDQIVTLTDADFPYRRMVEAMNEGAVTLVPDGTIFYCNPCFARMIDVQAEKLIGVQFQNFIQPDQREEFKKLLEQAGQAADLRREFLFQTSTAKRLPVQLSIYRLGSEATSGISVLITDISERIESEEKIRKLASELTIAEHEERHRISQILHDDLQQRLFAIKAQLSFLKLDESVTDAHITLEQLQKWLSDAITLTRDLSVDISPSVLRGEGLAQSILWLCSRMKEQYGLQLNISATDHLSQLDDHMRVLIFQTVRELLFNVVKHAGTLEASLLMERTPETGRVTISDSGKGFDADILLQDPTGAHGILLLRDRLLLMNGNMTIHSAPGQGTRVVIEFPIQAI
jgi:PAS domain S-box-containing protein